MASSSVRLRYDEFSRPLPDREEYLARLGVRDGRIAHAPSCSADASTSMHAPGASASSAEAATVPIDTPARELLDALVFAHQTRIPFEAIDSHDFKKPACLDIGVLFDKIIRGSRGGFCFELGALFGTLLSELGFRTAPCLARNVRAQEDFPPIMHRAELVDVDGVRCYADVGYGGPMAACAIPMVDGACVESCGQRFFMRKAAMLEGLRAEVAGGGMPAGKAATSNAMEHDARRVDAQSISAMQPAAPHVSRDADVPRDAETSGPWWLIEYQTGSMQHPAPLMYFLDAAMKPQDFDPLSFYCSAHPDSVFVRERLVNLRTPEGSKSIRNMTFTRVTAAGTTQRTLEGPSELQQILHTEFGISVALP